MAPNNIDRYSEPLLSTVATNGLLRTSIVVNWEAFINPGMKSDDFTETIEKKIYSELDLIC